MNCRDKLCNRLFIYWCLLAQTLYYCRFHKIMLSKKAAIKTAFIFLKILIFEINNYQIFHPNQMTMKNATNFLRGCLHPKNLLNKTNQYSKHWF